jgi:hypothetical protein
LDDRLAAHQGIRIEDHGIDALIAAGPRHLYLSSASSEHLIEEVPDKDLEVLPLHGHQVLIGFEPLEHTLGLDEARVLFVENAQRPDGLHACEPRPRKTLQRAEAGARVDTS